MPRTIQFEGTQHTFPDDATDEEISAALESHSSVASPAKPLDAIDRYHARLRAKAKDPQSNARMRQTFADLLPIAGSFLGPEGTVAGTMAKHAIQKDPGTLGDVAMDTGKQVLLNNAIPAGVGKALGKIPALVEKAPGVQSVRAGVSSKVADVINKSRIAKATQTQELVNSQAGEASALLQSQAANTNRATELINKSRVAKAEEANQVLANRVKNTEISIRNVSPEDMVIHERKALDNILGSGESINPDKALSALKTNKEFLTSDTGNRLNDLLVALKEQKSIKPFTAELDKTIAKGAQIRPGKINTPELVSPSIEPPPIKSGNLISTRSGRIALSVVSSYIGGPQAGLAVYIGSSGIKKLLSNPTVGQALINATKIPVNSEAAKIATRVLLMPLSGETLDVETEDGEKHKATVSADGELQPQR